MPQAFGSILSTLSGAQGGGQQMAGIGAGIGGVGQILQSVLQAQQLNKVKAEENLSPQALAQRVSSATQPLSAGLTENVGNVVQANMAERGLSQAPGIFATTESQALAPFYQQNQQTALALIAQQLGIPLQALTALMGGQKSDMSNLFTKLAMGNLGQVTGTPTTFPNPNLGSIISQPPIDPGLSYDPTAVT